MQKAQLGKTMVISYSCAVKLHFSGDYQQYELCSCRCAKAAVTMVTLISDYRCHEFAQTLPQIGKGYTINTLRGRYNRSVLCRPQRACFPCTASSQRVEFFFLDP